MPSHTDTRTQRTRHMQTTVQAAPEGRLVIDAPVLCQSCQRRLALYAARPWEARCARCKTTTHRTLADPVEDAA